MKSLYPTSSHPKPIVSLDVAMRCMQTLVGKQSSGKAWGVGQTTGQIEGPKPATGSWPLIYEMQARRHAARKGTEISWRQEKQGLLLPCSMMKRLNVPKLGKDMEGREDITLLPHRATLESEAQRVSLRFFLDFHSNPPFLGTGTEWGATKFIA